MKGTLKMRRVVVAVVALGMLGLGLAVTLFMPTQARTTLRAAEVSLVNNAAPTPLQLSSYEFNARPGRVERICQNNVVVKRDGRVIGHLHKGQKFKVIRPITPEFGFEVVAYHGFAYGNVNAYGQVPARALDCH